MKTIRFVLTTTLLVLGLAAGAHAAAILTTGPMRIDHQAVNGDVLACSVVNVGKKQVEVVITADLDNVVISPPYVLEPAEVATMLNTNTDLFTHHGRCRFSVKGGKKNVRASACALDQHDNCRAALVAR